MADLSLVFDLIAKDRASDDVKRVGDSFDRAGGHAEGFGSRIGGAMKFAAGAIVASGLFSGLSSLVDAAAESEKVGALTENAIRATGGAAGVTAEQVGDLATALSNKTGADDEAIQSGENLLLTFTNVRNSVGEGNNVFDRATGLALDMSTALGTDMTSASMQVGKALNDPVKGITALSRAGVSFTEQQKEQIKTMVASGDTLGAQGVILDELGREFGGAAEAAGTPADKLRTQIGNLAEQFGSYLVPILSGAASFLTGTVVPAVQTVAGWVGDNLGPIVTTVFTGIAQAVGTFAAAWTANDGTVTSSGLNGFMERLAFVLRGVFDYVRVTVIPALVDFGTWVKNNSGWLIPLAGAIAGVYLALQIYSAYQATVAFATKAWAAAQAILNVVMSANPLGIVLIVLAALVGAFIAAWTSSETFRNIITGALEWVGNIVSTVVGAIVGFFTETLPNAIGAVVNFFFELPGRIWDALSSLASTLWDAFTGAISNAVEGLAAAGVAIWDWFTSLPGQILDSLGDIGQLLWDVGSDLLSGLWDGISGAVDWLLGKIGDFFGSLLPDWVKDILGISSPSKMFAQFGRYSMEGFADGIRAGTGAAVAATVSAMDAVSGAADLGTAGLGYTAPRYDLPAGAAAGAVGATHTTIVSGVVGPEEVAAIVARDQRTTEFLAGV